MSCLAWKTATIVLVGVLLLLFLGVIVAYTAAERALNDFFLSRCKPLKDIRDPADPTQPMQPRESIAFARAAYGLFCDPTAVAWVPHGWSMIALPLQRGYVLHKMHKKHKVAIVSFRGTFSASDLLVDFGTYQDAAFEGKVHGGVWSAYLRIRAAVHEAINGADVVHVTGHSLGGALGILAAADLAAHDPHASLFVCAIAPPKVGDDKFAAHMQGLFLNMHKRALRILINYADVVPTAPSGLRGSCVHPLTPEGYYRDQGTWSRNHSVDTYDAIFSGHASTHSP